MEVSNVFSGFGKNIKKRFQSIAPYSETSLRRLSSECIMKTWFISGTAAVFVVFMNRVIEDKFSVYSVCSAFYVLFLLLRIIPKFVFRKKEDMFLEELSGYLSAVKRQFIYRKNIPDSILEGATGKSEEIVKNAAELVRILLKDNRREAVRTYIENSNKNRFMKLFLIQAFETSENGDVSRNGISSFSENIELLGLEIINEMYARKKKRYMFSGYMFVSVFPVLVMSAVKRAGLRIEGDMLPFYNGTGVLVILLVFLSSYFVVSVLEDNSTDMNEHTERNITVKGYATGKFGKIKADIEGALEGVNSGSASFLKKTIYRSGRKMKLSTLIAEMVLSFLLVLVVGVFFLFSQRDNERKEMLNKVENIDRIAVLARPEQKAKLENAILLSVAFFKEVDYLPVYEQALIVYRSFSGDLMKNYEEACVNEVVRRTKAYKSTYVHLYECIIVLLVAIFAATMPVLRLFIDSGIRNRAAVDEIKRFQMVIMMERHFDTLSIIGLLTDLELFSDVFRPEIRECINTYATGHEKALLRMKQKGIAKNKTFAEIADGFLSVDDVGIAEAFSDVEGNREFLSRMDELSETIYREKKKGVLDIIAWIPGVLVIFGYFVAPFMKSSLSNLSELFSMLENSGSI